MWKTVKYLKARTLCSLTKKEYSSGLFDPPLSKGITANRKLETLFHVSVCICTYKRLQLLSHLLNILQHQIRDNQFSYSIIVIDNDANQSAKAQVEDFQKSSIVPVYYFCEPQQNIARARNMAVENASGDYIAFIDDDEFPEESWLLNLLDTLRTYKADAVLGPVKPYYPENVPEWLIKSRLCERPSYPTGTLLHWSQTRTGNVLFDNRIFQDGNHRFRSEFGRTGGEDIEFFRMLAKKEKVFVWCDEAPVYETVLPERWNKHFYTKKLLRIGSLSGERLRKRKSFLQTVCAFVKSVAWILFMAIPLSLSRLLGFHVYMRSLAKFSYHVGRLSGLFGRPILRNRDD